MQDGNRPLLSPADNEGTGSYHPDLETLNAFLDGELTSQEQELIRRHLASCATCQEELQSLRATVSLLQGLPELEPRRSFQLTAELAAAGRNTEQLSEDTSQAASPRAEVSSGTPGDDSHDGEGRVLPFVPRTRLVAALAAVRAVIVVSAVFVDRMNDDNTASNPGGEAPPAAVMTTDEATGDEPTASGEEALFGGEAVVPSRRRERGDRPVYVVTPSLSSPSATDEATADGMLAVPRPTPTLVPLPSPPAILPSDAPTNEP